MFRRIWLERCPMLGLPGPLPAGVWFCSLPSVYLLSHCPSKQAVSWPRTSSEQKELMILFLCMASSTGHLGQVYQNVRLVFMWCLYSFYFFSHGIYLFETRTHVIALVYLKLTVYPRLTSNLYPFSCLSFLSACTLGTCHQGVLFKVLSRLLMTNPFHSPNSWQIICARDKCFMSFGNLREKGFRTCFSNRDTWLLLEWRSE